MQFAHQTGHDDHSSGDGEGHWKGAGSRYCSDDCLVGGKYAISSVGGVVGRTGSQTGRIEEQKTAFANETYIGCAARMTILGGAGRTLAVNDDGSSDGTVGDACTVVKVGQPRA